MNLQPPFVKVDFFGAKIMRVMQIGSIVIAIVLIILNFSSKAPEIYFTPSSDCENLIIKNIQKASEIDIAVYSINNDKIVLSIIVTDRLQAAGKHSKVQYLKDLGMSIRLNKKHKIEHNKFAVFDNKRVVTGSYNWTNPASSKNSENCLLIEDAKQNYNNRFEYLWNFYER